MNTTSHPCCSWCGRKIPHGRICGPCAKAHGHKKARRRREKEPTAKQLEALIAEQAAQLPTWWDLETRREMRDIPRVVARGMGIRVEAKDS